MDPLTLGAIALAALLIMLALRVPIAYALAALAFTCIFIYFAMRSGDFNALRAIRPTLTLAYSNYFDLIHHYDFSMVPLFILLGHLAALSGITTDIYYAARILLARIPGGVAIASIMGCGGFAAINGSSVACAAAMGKVCSLEMLKFGYDKRLATSSVAMGGTIGSMIPPSVAFVIYSIFTETSISQLFLAGILPGILILVGYIIVVMIWVRRNPSIAPTPDFSDLDEPMSTVILRAWPAAVLFLIIVGGIYGGIFTATESAGISVAFALVVSVLRRRLSFAQLTHGLRESASQSAAVFFIAGSAKMFVAYISLAGIAPAFVELVQPETLSAWEFLIGVILVYIVLGMFLDPLGIKVLTLPFMVPIAESLGLDLIWFGVVIVRLLEIGLVTPPLGLNVFVISNVVGDKVPIEKIFGGVWRFLVMDVVLLAIIVAFPILSLLIPYSM